MALSHSISSIRTLAAGSTTLAPAGLSSHHEALCCLTPSAAGHAMGGLLRQLHVLARQQPQPSAMGSRALLPLGPRQLIAQRGFADLPAHTEMQMPSLSPTMSQVTPASEKRGTCVREQPDVWRPQWRCCVGEVPALSATDHLIWYARRLPASALMRPADAEWHCCGAGEHLFLEEEGGGVLWAWRRARRD